MHGNILRGRAHQPSYTQLRYQLTVEEIMATVLTASGTVYTQTVLTGVCTKAFEVKNKVLLCSRALH